MKYEQVQKQIPRQRREQAPIDGMPESIYDQELNALTKLVLEHCDDALEDGNG